jgi:suppressor of G2 allele of SKP1
VSAVKETPPSYPTSSKTGSKNWDKLANEMEENEESQGGDGVQDFFKTLYSQADDDTKRAMTKSYTESGGTVLSTNWSEIAKKKTEVSPPDGMEEKRWEA